MSGWLRGARAGLVLAGVLGLTLAVCWPRDMAGAKTAVCGDGLLEGPGEDCDDANNLGGDGCAANCTQETALPFESGDAYSRFPVFAAPYHGQLKIVAGRPRQDAVIAANGETFEPGYVPAVIRAGVEAVQISGLACICVGGSESATDFGPGNAGAGWIGCGEQGLPEVGYDLVRDHDLGLDPAACAAAGGTVEPPDGMHPGACNGPAEITFTGGGPRGSMVFTWASSLTILTGTDCSVGGFDDPLKGADGAPCTADDTVPADVRPLVLTSGTASGTLLNSPLMVMPDVQCVGLPCAPEATGAPIDCGALQQGANPEDVVSGAALAGVYAELDQEQFGDIITAVKWIGRQAYSTPQPTPTGTPDGPATVVIEVGWVVGAPGDEVEVPVRLFAHGNEVADVENAIAFDLAAPIVRCERNAAIGREDTAFAFRPPLCTAGVDCTSVKSLIVSLSNFPPIPDVSVLYTCTVEINSQVPQSYTLQCLNARASDVRGAPLPVVCRDGAILSPGHGPEPSGTRTPPPPAPTVVVVIGDSPTPTRVPPGTATPTGGAGRGDENAAANGDGCQVANPDSSPTAWWLLLPLPILIRRRTTAVR